MTYNEFKEIVKENIETFSEFHEVDLMSEYITAQGFKIEIEIENISAGKVFCLPHMKITAIKENTKISKNDVIIKDAMKLIIDEIEKDDR